MENQNEDKTLQADEFINTIIPSCEMKEKVSCDYIHRDNTEEVILTMEKSDGKKEIVLTSSILSKELSTSILPDKTTIEDREQRISSKTDECKIETTKITNSSSLSNCNTDSSVKDTETIDLGFKSSQHTEIDGSLEVSNQSCERNEETIKSDFVSDSTELIEENKNGNSSLESENTSTPNNEEESSPNKRTVHYINDEENNSVKLVHSIKKINNRLTELQNLMKNELYGASESSIELSL